MATWYCNKSGWNATRVFTISGVTTLPVAGDTYTNNSVTFTVVGATTTGSAPSISGYLFCTGSGAPAASGNLTRATGSGDATIAFSAYQAGGTSVTAAYKTINGTAALAASGDSVVVGSGLYNEVISISKSDTVYSVIFYANGNVVVDGTGLGVGPLLNGYCYSNNGVSSLSISFYPLVSGGSWKWKNCNNTNICYIFSSKSINGILNNCSLSCKNNIFISNSNSYGVNISSNVNFTLTMSNCVMYDFLTYAVYNSTGATYTVAFYNNTIYNCTNAVYSSTSSSSSFIYKNIFSNISGYAINSNTTTAGAISKNQYYSVGKFRASSIDYNTLTDWQAAGYDAGSITEQPNFEDATNDILFLTSASSLGRDQGAYPFGYCTGSNASDAKWIITASADNTGWYNADGNVSKNGTTGYFELIADSVGTIVSPIIDLGSIQAIKQINLEVDQTWGTHMVDYDITDVRPNYQTVRIRASTSSFNQDDAILSWIEWKTDMDQSIVTGRYVQVELTLRSNDVPA